MSQLLSILFILLFWCTTTFADALILPGGGTITGTLPPFGSIPVFNIGTLNGASTAANQTTANTSLSSIDSKITNPMPVSGTVAVTQTALINGQISNSSSITTSASTFTAPANAIGFILEAESGNTDNIRWAIGSTATSSVGMLAEPGRDSGYIPLAANISVIAISGTQTVDVQWVMR